MNKADRIIGVLVVLFGVAVILISAGMHPAARQGIPGPALLPRMVSGALILCGLLLFSRAMVRKADYPVAFNREARARLAGVILLTVLTAVGLAYIGFIVSCLLSAFIFLIILGLRMRTAALTAVAVTAGIYLVFHYGLRVQFPMSTVW